MTKSGSPKVHDTILFDVSRLFRTALRHSGISRYIDQLFRGMLQDARNRPSRLVVLPVVTDESAFRDQDRDRLIREFKDTYGDVPLDRQACLQLVQQVIDETGRPCVFFSPYEAFPHYIADCPVKRAIMIHDVFHMERSDLYGHKFSNTHIQRVTDRLSKGDLVLTNSEFTRMQVIQTLGHPERSCATTYLGSAPAFRSGVDKREKTERAGVLPPEPYFVTLSQDDARKNHTATLEAALLALEDPALSKHKCVVVVSENREEMLRQSIKSLTGSDRLIVRAGVDDIELAQIYEKAEFALFSSFAEGFGLPVLEAMACGCPVITSATTALPEVGRDGCIYVNPRKPQQIVDAIVMLAKSESLRKTLSDSAKEIGRLFTWENCVQSTLACLLEHASTTQPALTAKDFRAIRNRHLVALETVIPPVSTSKVELVQHDDIDLGKLGQHKSFAYVENRSNQSHGIQYSLEAAPTDSMVHLAVLFKPMGRLDYTVLLKTQDDASKDNEVTLVMSVQDRQCRLSHRSHRQWVKWAEVLQKENGWCVLSLAFNLVVPGGKGISCTILGRPDAVPVRNYSGGNFPMAVFAPALIGT